MVNLKEKLQKYIDKYLKEEIISCEKIQTVKLDICESLSYAPRSCSAKVCSDPVKTFIKETIDPNDFKTVLFRMIEESMKKDKRE